MGILSVQQLTHTMDLTLTEIDISRLQSLRIARLVELVPPLSDLMMSQSGQTLCIELPYNLMETTAIALGTNQIELYAEEQMLCRLSLESVKSSNNPTQHITMAAVLEQETNATIPSVISWRIIASNTGETETDIKRRSHSLGINFYWVSEGDDWGVLTQDAQELASRYYIDMGNTIARTLGGGEMTDAQDPLPKPPEPIKEKRRSPKPPINFKGEFKPTKNPKVTVERYLSAIALSKEEQLQVLHEIVTDAGIARRHLNKALANISADLKDSTTRAKLQAAFTNLHERMQQTSKQPAPAAQAENVVHTSESD